jgi:hypothetical protein
MVQVGADVTLVVLEPGQTILIDSGRGVHQVLLEQPSV